MAGREPGRAERLQRRLAALAAGLREPATLASAHDVPDFVFVYEPRDELLFRDCLPGFARALAEVGRRAVRISLAEEMWAVLREGGWLQRLAEAEAEPGADLVAVNDTVARLLAAPQTGLEARVLQRIVPPALDPESDLAVLERAGALFPVYRTSALIQRLEGVPVPVVVGYPGTLEPPYGLRLMGRLAPDARYRATILADDGGAAW